MEEIKKLEILKGRGGGIFFYMIFHVNISKPSLLHSWVCHIFHKRIPLLFTVAIPKIAFIRNLLSYCWVDNPLLTYLWLLGLESLLPCRQMHLWCKCAQFHWSQMRCFLLHEDLIWSSMFRSLSYPLWPSNSAVERLPSACKCQ